MPKPDFVYVRGLYSAIAAARLGVPVIWESHGFQNWIEINAVKFLLRQRNLHSIVVVSEGLRVLYLNALPWVSPERIVLARNGAPSFAEDDGTLLPWPGRNGVIQVGYVGNIYRGRGIDILLEAATSMPEADFHIIGGAREEVIGLYPQQEIPQNAHFHGKVPPGQISQYYAHLDITLAPYQARVGTAQWGVDTSRWMSPIKMFEYMAAGKAIVCSDLPTIREIVDDGETGIICQPESVSAWIEAIRKLQADRVLRERLGREAKKKATEELSWKRRAERIIEAIRDPIIARLS